MAEGGMDVIRVVEASLAPPLWVGPVREQEAPQHDEEKTAMAKVLADYGKMVVVEEAWCWWRKGSGTPERLLLGPLQVCTFSRLPCHQTFHRLQETAWESVKGLTAWEGVERREEKVPCRLGVSSRSDCMGVCSRECV